ncbi:hypothetical protein CRUP_014002 [Coryphaenoides rupestris]|nr:hypothetical protein CRUP_014002 [Coryphaenoides rupestris]
MAERQHVLEDAYKIEISANHAAEAGPTAIGDVSPLWQETASKAWQIHTDSERRKLVPGGYQKKLGLISTAVRSALGRPGRDAASVQDFLSCMECHRQRGHSMFESMEANYKQVRQTRILLEVAPEPEEEAGHDCDQLTFFPMLTEMPATTAAAAAASGGDSPAETCNAEPCSHTHACADMHAILQELDSGEETSPAALRVKDSHRVKDPFISSMITTESPSVGCRRWPYADVKEARFMRYLLEDNALEILIKDGHSAFLVFLNRDHVSVYKRKSPVVGKKATLKWQRGDMSNFEYLMHLNTLAGRTYNDMMQYPVFPWVLADYLSETLDLSNPATFRDLSKPMGAQTEKRREMFVERYEDMDNSDGDMLAHCHYYTHYSSAIIVASFLVRMEPFCNTFQTLQSLNTFHPYFYARRRTRGQEALLDPVVKSTMLGYVNNFGQVPKQRPGFCWRRRPSPRRRRGTDCDQLTFFPMLTEMPGYRRRRRCRLRGGLSGRDLQRRALLPHTRLRDMHAILQELDSGEEVKAKHCVLVVSGPRLTEGLLLFGKESVYLCESFTLSAAGDVCCRKHHPSRVKDPFISSMITTESPSVGCRRWPYADVKEARFMRYLLEVTTLWRSLIKDGHSAFLVFLNRDHVSVYKRY